MSRIFKDDIAAMLATVLANAQPLQGEGAERPAPRLNGHLEAKDVAETIQEAIDGLEARKAAATGWQAVPDDRVMHIWKDAETGEEIEIPPTFYENSGTPVSGESGEDCEYLRTEVKF